MDKNFLIQLTNELYRLTLLFPKKEPLRYKMRELADDILSDSLRITLVRPVRGTNGSRTNSYEYTNTNKNDSSKKFNEERYRYIRDAVENLEVLDGFFEVAKNQNWVSPSEILKLQLEYSKVREELKKTPVPQNNNNTPPDARHQKILEVLKEKGKAQVWELKKIFPSITKRTIRRDFRYLLKQGLIERFGERNETFYKIKSNV